MSDLGRALLAQLDDDDLARLAERVGPRLAERLAPVADEWLDAERAAAYLSCDRERVYDLVQLGKLEPARDGRRLLFRRSGLDAYVTGTAVGPLRSAA